MAINIVKGNLLEAPENIIAHQVNCLGIMGAGVAFVIKKKYPKVFKEYSKYTKDKSAKELLGQNLMITSDGMILRNGPITNNNTKIVANLYGQNFVGKYKQQTDIVALETALTDLFVFAKLNDFSLALPYGIGCGLGGGNWNDVLTIITRLADNYPVTLYKLA